MCYIGTFIFDDAEKSTVSHTVLTCSKQHLHNTKREDLAESTGVVPAKYPIMRTLVSENIEPFIIVEG